MEYTRADGRKFEVSKGDKSWNLFTEEDGRMTHVDAYPTRKAALAAAERCSW